MTFHYLQVKTPYGGDCVRRWFQRYGYAETVGDDWDTLWRAPPGTPHQLASLLKSP